MKIIDDTLKSRGKWSVGRLTMLATFIGNLAFAAWSVYKTGAMPDLPPKLADLDKHYVRVKQSRSGWYG